MKLSSKIYKLCIKIFEILPFKKIICLILRWINIPNEKFYKDLRFYGLYNVKYNGYSFKLYHYYSTIENEIFWKGLGKKWESDTIWLWKELSLKSEVIFDIGANTGVYSILSKSVNSNSQVHAFEPSNGVFPKLEKNCFFNGFDIKCWKLAFSNFSGFQSFYDSHTNLPTSGSLSSKKFFDECEDDTLKFEYNVKTRTVDEFIFEEKMDKVDLIKIDVEMHEGEVMEGFKSCNRMRPIIFIEILTDEIAAKIEEEIKNYNYSYYELDFERLIPISHLKKGKPYHWNFLLVPNEKNSLVSNYITDY